jgi:hypothetical protein
VYLSVRPTPDRQFGIPWLSPIFTRTRSISFGLAVCFSLDFFGFSRPKRRRVARVSERTFRRWQVRYEEEGEAGLLDRRLYRGSGNRVPVDRKQEVEALYRQRYVGIRAKHEHLVKDHGFAWGYTWTKLFLQSRGLLTKVPRKEAHRRKRERRSMSGSIH